MLENHYWENHGYTMKELNKAWTQEELWNLRQQIPLCSLFVKDYINTFHVDPECVYAFFDSYADYLETEMEECEDSYKDKQFHELFLKYDTPEALYDWWSNLEYSSMNEGEHCLPCPPGYLKTNVLRIGESVWREQVYTPRITKNESEE